MIIDGILDRYDELEETGVDHYSAHDFYYYVYGYRDCMPDLSDPITMAMDYGGEDDIRRELCLYVIKCNYNPLICNFIKAVTWLDPVKEYKHICIEQKE